MEKIGGGVEGASGRYDKDFEEILKSGPFRAEHVNIETIDNLIERLNLLNAKGEDLTDDLELELQGAIKELMELQKSVTSPEIDNALVRVIDLRDSFKKETLH